MSHNSNLNPAEHVRWFFSQRASLYIINHFLMVISKPLLHLVGLADEILLSV